MPVSGERLQDDVSEVGASSKYQLEDRIFVRTKERKRRRFVLKVCGLGRLNDGKMHRRCVVDRRAHGFFGGAYR